MCGLKHSLLEANNFLLDVTPHVGVWIETLIQTISVQPILVTPHVGVWIETQMGSG